MLDARDVVCARVDTVPTTSREVPSVLPGSAGTTSVSSVTVKQIKEVCAFFVHSSCTLVSALSKYVLKDVACS